ncbi:VOC family protein [Frankia sp. CNm7]|uniref:VOC family protein n=1 Tax=Frankia nepalensis TaxID=1836974 RepID=A0A937UUU4_9ACTN|nr:VOC family protein [Frankia nepalensis]MBL7500656.1 VOC family protein [Frankia nepalensis]MBL7514181.1 VOC family protein [Frankia nepalensis]MBL7522589.1 VOC family protein [Frankia nepalensis]MBL7632610.1 VOC family protein [Frankia nepalensis]
MRHHARVAGFETHGLRVARVGVDCVDVDRMIRFWSRALGYEVARRGGDTAELRHPASAGPKLLLRQVRKLSPARNRLQLDLYAVDAERVAGWLATLGAKRVRRLESNGASTEAGYLLADPEGNEFRVITAGPAAFTRPFV